MKVKFGDKKLFSDFFGILSVISICVSLMLAFFDICQDLRMCIGKCFLVFLFVIYLYLWFKANFLRKITIRIRGSIVEIVVGDIFNLEGFKIIPFNEYFDTQVDNRVIAENSLNGQYINRYFSDRKSLDEIIANDERTKNKFIIDEKRKIGKQKKYDIGTIIKYEDYFLIAFSMFDDDNRAYLSIDKYIACLTKMWDECDILYNGKSVVLPLLGGGITRFYGYEDISDQELLELILWSFKFSRINFENSSKVTIVLTKSSLKNINLYQIKKRFDS